MFNHVTFGFPSPQQYSCQTALIIPAKGFIFGAFSMKCCKTPCLPSLCQSVYLAPFSTIREHWTNFHEIVCCKKKVQLCRWARVECVEGVQRCIFALCTALQYMEVSDQLRAPAAILPVEKKSYDPPANRSTDRAAYNPFQMCTDIPEI